MEREREKGEREQAVHDAVFRKLAG